MIKIITSVKNLPEKKYVFDVIFGEFLKIDYEIETVANSDFYEIIISANKKIIIEDHFWKYLSNEKDYLSKKYLPANISFIKNEFTQDENIPILFGRTSIAINGNNIICGIDLIAGIFFFLSRWEEFVCSVKDQFNRFRVKDSIAYKFNLVYRPVVNEYLELLWYMMLKAGYTGKREKKVFTPVITHDIDQPIRLSNFKMFAKSALKNLIVFNNISGVFRDTIVYPLNKFNPKYDIANTYNFLMDVSDSIGIKSHFNFQNCVKTKYDWGYNIRSNFIKNIFNNIKDRKHIIGFHPSYNTIDEPDLWRQEYQELCDVSEYNITSGRQHYLRFKIPFTWQIWENNGLAYDSTLGFAESEGFRCGTCYEFSTYNFITRKKLRLKENPLVFMEKSVTNYQNKNNTSDFEIKFKNIYNTVKKYGGNFVFLWHNSSFDTKIFTKYKYNEMINYLK